MQPQLEDLCNTLSMTEIIRMQNLLSAALVRRFERSMALVFSDIVGSTPYFARFGDEAGKQMQQKHLDLLNQAIAATGGRIVHTAGDGVFLCFDAVDEATASMVGFLRLLSKDNAARDRQHQLAVRIGIHFGPVLTDGVQVTGDSVNFCSRVAASAEPGEVRLTRAAFFSFSDLQFRLKCRALLPVAFKGVDEPVILMTLDWRDRAIFPTLVRVDGGEEYKLPDQDIISFGRLAELDGFPANDIVLKCEDELQNLKISRWHFELRRRPDGMAIRAVSNAPTALNERPLTRGEERPLRSGDRVRVGNVLLLHFLTPVLQEAKRAGQATTVAFPLHKTSDHDGT